MSTGEPIPNPGVDTRRFVDDSDDLRRRTLENTVWNYLGMRDPVAVGQWICEAREAVVSLRAQLADAIRERDDLIHCKHCGKELIEPMCPVCDNDE